MYQIESKSDFSTGASLVVRIPEDELDKKALYTILDEQPGFLLPFRHITVDGQIEFTFQVGNRSKLAYLSGNRSPSEYADLWFHILHPLLNCDDFFMDPYSFVLKPEHLYCDNNKNIFFVYIPSLSPCSDYDTLKSMVTEVARQNHVTDMTLENKVVWAIQDFSLAGFLEMLRPYRGYAAQGDAAQGSGHGSGQGSGHGGAQGGPPHYAGQGAGQPYQHPEHGAAQQYHQPAPSHGAAQQYQSAPSHGAAQQAPPPQPARSGLFRPSGKQKTSEQQVQAPPPPPPPPPPPASLGRPDDIAIVFPPDGKEAKREKAKKAPPPKKEKETKEPKEKGGFLGKKKQPQQEIIQGAAAMPMQQPQHQQPQHQQPQFQQAPFQQAPHQQAAQQQAPYQQAPVYSAPPQGAYDDGATQIDLRETAGGPRFRYIGNGAHPGLIQIPIAPGGMFTIGRYDPAAGPGQSTFEFSKDTKAVSRRHAVIERNSEGFMLVDLNSSAGTFVNGRKLLPNTPCKLETGSRVSFGYSGADYNWEE